MGGFNAETVVEKLEWSFKPFVDAAGVIPEPSDKLVDVFWAELGRITKTTSRTEAVEKLGALDDAADDETDAELAEAAEIGQKTAAVFADLCQQCPTLEQIQGLPTRQKAAFYHWVCGQLVNPE